MAERAAIIGSGLIGRAWCISFARGGWEVALYDSSPGAVDAALGIISGLLPDLEEQDLLNGQSPDALLSRIRPTTDLAEALSGVSHVQENTPERVEVKREVFARLDALAPRDAVLASSTSGILPSAFTEDLAGRERCLVAHPINPPYLVPAVEVVPAPWTSQEALEATQQRLEAIGQSPIMMTRECPGFLMNRIQAAVLNEAYRLVDGGYCTAEEVDRGLKDGVGLRWAFIGPFEVGDLNAPKGFRDYVERYGPLWTKIGLEQTEVPDLGGETLNRICAERESLLPLDRVQARMDWRDRRLMALAAHKRQAERKYGK